MPYNKKFQTTQFGWVIVSVFAVIMVVLGVLIAYFKPQGPALWILIACLVLNMFILLLFYNLKLEVSKNHVRFKMGIGLIRGSYAIRDIKSCKPVKNKWWYGWGVRLLPSCTIYNVSGLKAIEIEFKNRTRKIRIGTFEPEEVSKLIMEKKAALEQQKEELT